LQKQQRLGFVLAQAGDNRFDNRLMERVLERTEQTGCLRSKHGIFTST
jgi:hypothetical protein